MTRFIRWVRTAPLRARSLFARDRVEAELEEELRYHVDEHTAQLIARGMSVGEARTAALRAMGGMERRKEECRAERRVNVAEHLAADIRYGFRRLRRSPGFTTVALLTLALGLGANTAIFTVVNGVLLRPLGYANPDRLVVPAGTVPAGDFLDWREHNRTFARIGAAEWWTPTLTGGERPEQITALHISADILPLLGIEPMLGRVPRADEEHAGAAPVVVLSFRSWKTRFAADSHAVGRTMIFNGIPHTIIGVMPAGFQFAPFWATQAELWAPLDLDARRNDHAGASLRVFGRLAPGVTRAQARADLASIIAPLDHDHAVWAQRLAVVPLRSLVVEDVESQLTILQAAVVLLLLIACANVAHLQLMRAAAGTRERAVRVALGAPAARLLQQSLVESVLLCTGGAIFGLLLGYAGVRALLAVAPPSLPRIDSVVFDVRVFAYLGVAAMFSALLCGIAPSLRLSRVAVGDAMRSGRGSSDTPRRRRVRGVLVASEFAMTMVLLVGAGLVLRSFGAILAVHPGFDAAHVVSMELDLHGTTHAADSAHAPFFDDLLTRVRALPGVTEASMTNHIPIAGDHWTFSFAVDGQLTPVQGVAARALFRIAMPGYFGAMRIPIVDGREFSVDDSRASSHVAIINQAMAREHWPGADPVGARIAVGDPDRHSEWFTVVGVADDVKQGRWTDDTVDEMYFPYLSPVPGAAAPHTLLPLLHPGAMTLVVRTSGETGPVTRAVRDIVFAMDHDVAVANAAPLQRIVAAQFVQPRFYLVLLGSFAVVAVLLAAVGVYGVISYSVAQRTRELGVRAALGASQNDAFSLVMREGLALAGAGAAAGIVATIGCMRFARALLYHVQPTDAATIAAVCVLLGAVAAAACCVPARRASRVDPLTALRAE